MIIPVGTTHIADMWGEPFFYQRVEVPYLNQLIDHPEEQWQKLVKWNVFERGKWVDVGRGFSDRRLRPI